MSAYELVSMDGHPILYDYLSTAHSFWDNYSNGRIDFPDEYTDDYKSGKTAIVIDAYLSLEHSKKEHMIQGFEIYLDEKISLESGLDLAKTYLPIDILEKWYHLSDSRCYYSKEEETRYYYLLYVPNEDDEEEIKKLNYNYAMLLLCLKNDELDYMCIKSTNTIPKYLYNYELEEWSYDFFAD